MAHKDETYAEKFSHLPKVMVWLFVASSLVVILTMQLSMLPVVGTDALVQQRARLR